jgi:hypothetical protein
MPRVPPHRLCALRGEQIERAAGHNFVRRHVGDILVRIGRRGANGVHDAI